MNMVEGKHHKRDTFIWLPGYRGTDRVQQMWGATEIQQTAIRSSYYASVVGDVQTVEDTEQKLWDLGFTPNVYKKARKDQKAKGIDVALTKDMLTHAFLGNYEAAILFAGDGDYVPLVEEVKRFGKRVHVAFFEGNGMSPHLKRASDSFFDLTHLFLDRWNGEYPAQPRASQSAD